MDSQKVEKRRADELLFERNLVGPLFFDSLVCTPMDSPNVEKRRADELLFLLKPMLLEPKRRETSSG